MKFKSALFYFIYCFTILLLSACSNTKNIALNDSLYLGSSLNINDKQATKKERKFLSKELNGAIRPLPNKKVLGMRIKLRLYNFAGVPKKPKGFKNWLRHKVGEPPVFTSSFSVNTNEKLLHNVLQLSLIHI